MPAAELRSLAVAHLIDAETLVSLDGQQWIRAKQVGGLFEPSRVAVVNELPWAESLAAETDSRPAARARRRTTPVGTQAGSRFPWPIVRVRPLRWSRKKEIVRITAEGISIGITRQEVSEELLSKADWSASLKNPKHIWREEIDAIRTSRAGYLTASSLWCRFELIADGKRHRFRVPDRDLPNVVSSLRQIARERFFEKPSRHLALGEWFLITLAVVAIGALTLSLTFPEPGSLLKMMSIVIGFPCAILVAAFTPTMALDRRISQFRAARPARPRRRRAFLRRPFSSPLLGWSLKIAALLYMIGIYLFSEAILPNTGNQSIQTSLLGLLEALGLVVLLIGYRLCLRSFIPGGHPDPRPPILFLRAFDDDGKRSFQPSRALARLHGIVTFRNFGHAINLFWLLHPVKLAKLFLNADRHSAEELLSAAFRGCGPLIAIGRPGEILETAGADRMYVADEEWQAVVMEYLKTSLAVVIQPATTVSVRWELEQVFRNVPRERILLSMLNFKERPNQYEDFREWIGEEHRLQLPVALPFQDTPNLVYFEPDETVRCQPICYRSPLLWTFVGNAVDMGRTLRTFIQGLYGRAREAPLQPRRHAWHAPLSALTIVVLFIWAIFPLAATRRMVQHNAAVELDILRNHEAEDAYTKAYHTTRVPFTMTLSRRWTPMTFPLHFPNVVFAFKYGADLGTLIVQADQRQLDISSDAALSAIQAQIEKEWQDTDLAIAELMDSSLLHINGSEWRALTFNLHYGWGINRMLRVLMSSGPRGTMIAMFQLPGRDTYLEMCDEIVSTFNCVGE